MAAKTYDIDVSVVGKVSQTGTPSGDDDLITKEYLDDNAVQSTTIRAIVEITQAGYDALSPPASDTYYLVVG